MHVVGVEREADVLFCIEPGDLVAEHCSQHLLPHPFGQILPHHVLEEVLHRVEEKGSRRDTYEKITVLGDLPHHVGFVPGVVHAENGADDVGEEGAE